MTPSQNNSHFRWTACNSGCKASSVTAGDLAPAANSKRVCPDESESIDQVNLPTVRTCSKPAGQPESVQLLTLDICLVCLRMTGSGDLFACLLACWYDKHKRIGAWTLIMFWSHGVALRTSHSFTGNREHRPIGVRMSEAKQQPEHRVNVPAPAQRREKPRYRGADHVREGRVQAPVHQYLHPRKVLKT